MPSRNPRAGHSRRTRTGTAARTAGSAGRPAVRRKRRRSIAVPVSGRSPWYAAALRRPWRPGSPRASSSAQRLWRAMNVPRSLVIRRRSRSANYRRGHRRRNAGRRGAPRSDRGRSGTDAVPGGILAAVPDPAAHEDGALAQHVAIAGVVPLRQRCLDLVDQGGRQPLVGVETEGPRGGDRQVIERPVALHGVVLERMLDHMATGGARDRHGTIGTAGIDDEDLGVQPVQTRSRRAADSPARSTSG